MEIVFVLCVIFVPLLIFGEIALWFRTRRIIRNPTNILVQRFARYEWIICVWFTIGIVALLFTLFDISSNGIALRADKTSSDNILSTLITFLVAWQIWQTINAKQTIEKLQEELQQNKFQTKIDVNDSSLMCAAMIAVHEGLEAWNSNKDAATAYIKIASALMNYTHMHGGIINKDQTIEDCKTKLRQFLNELAKEEREIERLKFNQYDKDLDVIYDSIIKLSEKVKLSDDLISHIKKLNNERKALLKKWGYQPN